MCIDHAAGAPMHAALRINANDANDANKRAISEFKGSEADHPIRGGLAGCRKDRAPHGALTITNS